ncbi:putative calcium-binding protein CML19 [Oryza brachyantha]|uniref:EF-hand domain-containing protein n=1 Tax=Oryza brachyantha TaxID=4533 RepID=J3L7Y9_ORYBR|nr:putative calcium-binding protein CML19 [Oryza brachyantha]
MAAATAEFRRVFTAFDRDADGKISAAELRLCMKAALGEDMSAEEAEALVSSADADGDGLLDEEEFTRLVQLGMDEEERCRGLREAFRMYEMEGEERITPVSLKRMLSKLGSHQDIEECQAMICRFDLNGDGVISFEEFKIMMEA